MGIKLLVYARMRYDDPEGDVGRQKRQREVIGAIVTKLLKLDGFTQYKNILDAVSTNLQTDIEINASTIPSLLGYKDSLNTLESYQLDGEGEMVDGLSYQIPTSKHLLEMQNVLKRSLGLPEATELKTNVRVYEKVFGLSNPYTVIDAYTGEETPGTGVFDATEETTTKLLKQHIWSRFLKNPLNSRFRGFSCYGLSGLYLFWIAWISWRCQRLLAGKLGICKSNPGPFLARVGCIL